MALENLLDASLTYDDGLASPQTLSVASRLVTSAGKRVSGQVQNVGTSEEAVQLGGMTAPGAVMLKNLDPTNFINVKVGTGGAIFAKLRPDTNGDSKGGFVLIDCMGSGAQAPFVVADTATCRMVILAIEL